LKKFLNLIKKYPIIYGALILFFLFIAYVPEGQKVKTFLGSLYTLMCDRNAGSCEIKIKNP